MDRAASPESNDIQHQLSEDEAAGLASELKAQLRLGVVPSDKSENIERMVAGLGDPRGLMRLTFAESLGMVGQAAVPALCRVLQQSDNVTVRRAAAKTLTLIEDPKALPVLVHALLNDPDPVVQGSAVGAMAAVGAEAVAVLMEVFVNPQSTAMQLGLASWGLAFVGARAPEALRNAAKADDPGIRAAAVAALGDQIQSLEDHEARNLVVNALRDPATDVRAEAATLLGKLNDPGWAYPMLIPILRDQESQVRKNAALSLMKLQATEALPSLKSCSINESQDDVQAVFKLVINQLEKNLTED